MHTQQSATQSVYSTFHIYNSTQRRNIYYLIEQNKIKVTETTELYRWFSGKTCASQNYHIVRDFKKKKKTYF